MRLYCQGQFLLLINKQTTSLVTIRITFHRKKGIRNNDLVKGSRRKNGFLNEELYYFLVIL
jgi:hypothetical protein